MTLSQQVMIEDGFPAALFLSQEERRLSWEKSPPQPMPTFAAKRENEPDPAALALLAELEEKKALKTKSRIAKMLAKKEDTKGKVWCMKTCKWVPFDNKPKVIVETTCDKTKVISVATKAPNGEEKRQLSTDLVTEFGVRVGSDREKLLTALAAGLGSQVPVGKLLTSVYGSPDPKRTEALLLCVEGLIMLIDRNGLPYKIKKARGSVGMWTKVGG